MSTYYSVDRERQIMLIYTGKERPGWDDYFFGIAKAISTRASCPRASCGAVIVDEENRILATGYNGAPSGEEHCVDIGCLIEDDHCQRALHAEVNAIAYAARAGVPVKGSTLYLFAPRDVCRECRKVITSAGIVKLKVCFG